jgi:hypothetical protein
MPTGKIAPFLLVADIERIACHHGKKYVKICEKCLLTGIELILV